MQVSKYDNFKLEFLKIEKSKFLKHNLINNHLSEIGIPVLSYYGTTKPRWI